MPLFMAFLRRYPDVQLDVVTEGRRIDIVIAGFDAGIRLAQSVPQDMIAVPFGRLQRFAVVGSPDYFARRARSSSSKSRGHQLSGASDRALCINPAEGLIGLARP
jgi:DNA-binding transcriptional LysR family regulator